MWTEKSFDELLSRILTDYQNEFNGEVDTSQGSLVFIKSACLASAVWGLHQHQKWISRQIFPDTAETEYLEHHAWNRDITRRTGETDDELLERLLLDLRYPPSGGNQYDYVRWALEIENVKHAWCFPLEDGYGTVMVVITANAETTGSETPTSELLAEADVYIDEKRPVTAAGVTVVAPTFLETDVTMTVTGSAINTALIAGDIEEYLNGFEPGQILYLTQLTAIAIRNGADDAGISDPSGSVIPENYEIIRPGTISVTTT